MTDSHAHLDACAELASVLVERALGAGVTRIVTIGTGIDSCRAALAIAEENEGVYAALGVDPHQAATPEARRLDELRELLRHPKAVAVGETGLDSVRQHASAEDQRLLFDAQLALADELGLPVVIHSREAEAETANALEGFGGRVVLHCFSSPGLLPVALERGYYVSFAGNATYPKAQDLRAAAAAVPADRILVETDSPYLAPQPVRGRPNEPAHVVHTVAALAEARGETPEELGALSHAQRCGGVRHPMNVTPKKSLGQHFLADENILGVIGRLADLEPEDVVLEVGPGLGVLTRYLADRVRLVHAVEFDRTLEEPLRDALGERPNVRLVFGDALELDLTSLDPPPGKLVSNLPYNIATPLVVESLERVPTLDRWCVMVQREVADRFFASPSTKAYGAVSVLVQLAARRTGFHRVSPTVFRPRPRVESALVAFERVNGQDLAEVRPVVEAAFAHRRKTLVNSVALAGLASRPAAEQALEELGRSARVRAEELEPQEFVALARELRRAP